MLRLMSYNIHFGGLGRPERIAQVINQAQPDLVVLQEATHPHIVEQLAELTNMPHWTAKARHSTAFLSRSAVPKFRWHRLPRLERAVLEIELDGVRVFGVHLRATHSNYTERGRMHEVRAILDVLEQYKDEFHLLVGDFNTLAPGELLNMRKLPARYKVLAFMLGGRLSFRAIQLLIDAGYLDCYRKFHTDPGFTFPAWDPHVRLDYFFTPREWIDRVASCDVMANVIDPAKATDHLPLIAEISLS
jgi:endonuclease/exonuclease/phosphatase family metal-dependent hydrolase